MAGRETIWQLLAECVADLDEPFERSQVFRWFRRNHPEVHESSLAAHLQSATANAPGSSKVPGLANRTPLVTRVGRGLYVRYVAVPKQVDQDSAEENNVIHVPTRRRTPPRLVLIGSSIRREKKTLPAREMYAGDLFTKAREYAEQRGLRWYVLSAKWGLLHPDELVPPNELDLASCTSQYRNTWGHWVGAQLVAAVGPLSGHIVEVHAAPTYVQPIRRPLSVMAADLREPLSGLRPSEQLAWYRGAADTRPSNLPSPRSHSMDGEHVDELVAGLQDASRAVTPADFLGRGRTTWAKPGLYAWWVDTAGAVLLTDGLGIRLDPSLIYAGQAGATRPGLRTASTLWARIADQQLGGPTQQSTFRQILAAVLRIPLDLPDENAPQLTGWMHAHLRLVTIPALDTDRLGQIEEAVLRRLDPPLNLRGMTETPVRRRISTLRANRQVGGQAGG